MRRSQLVLIGVVSGLLSVLLAVAVNVATGGELPGPLAAVSWLAWPAVGLLAVAGIWLAYLQQRVSDVDTGAAPASPRSRCASRTSTAAGSPTASCSR